jgi:serine/threonine protein kinase
VRARQLQIKREVAIKTFHMRPKAGHASTAHVESMRGELAALMRLQPSAQPNIANVLSKHESPHAVHIVLEYCAGGTLMRHLQKLGDRNGMPEKESAAVVGQVARALAHMHQLGVTHRDVKPSNLVFDNASHQTVRLVDFGFAALHLLDHSSAARRLHTLLGTPA